MIRLTLLALLLTTTVRAEDETPETKAIISKLKDDLKSKSAPTRTSAYKAMGELGAKSLRRTLCEGMMDKNDKTKVAAADSLKQIDPEMYKLALAIHINHDIEAVHTATRMKSDAEPLTPLVLAYAFALAPTASQIFIPNKTPNRTQIRHARTHLTACIEAMTASAPEDTNVNSVVISVLTNQIPELRHCAANMIPQLKNRKLALKQLILMATNLKEDSTNRLAAIKAIPDCVDENTKTLTKKNIETIRFDNHPGIRAATETLMKKLDE